MSAAPILPTETLAKARRWNAEDGMDVRVGVRRLLALYGITDEYEGHELTDQGLDASVLSDWVRMVLFAFYSHRQRLTDDDLVNYAFTWFNDVRRYLQDPDAQLEVHVRDAESLGTDLQALEMLRNLYPGRLTVVLPADTDAGRSVETPLNSTSLDLSIRSLALQDSDGELRRQIAELQDTRPSTLIRDGAKLWYDPPEPDHPLTKIDPVTWEPNPGILLHDENGFTPEAREAAMLAAAARGEKKKAFIVLSGEDANVDLQTMLRRDGVWELFKWMYGHPDASVVLNDLYYKRLRPGAFAEAISLINGALVSRRDSRVRAPSMDWEIPVHSSVSGRPLGMSVNREKDRKNYLEVLNVAKNAEGEQLEIWDVIKSNGYGSGLLACADNVRDLPHLAGFCVGWPLEAIKLRNEVKGIPILQLVPAYEGWYDELIENDITFSISNSAHLRSLAEAAERHPDKRVKIHIEVNTGMNRFGVGVQHDNGGHLDLKPLKSLLEEIRAINSDGTLIHVDGAYSHFESADHPDPSKRRIDEQLELFGATTHFIEQELGKDIPGFELNHIHIENSAAALVVTPEQRSRYRLTGIRPGVLLRGSNPLLDCEGVVATPDVDSSMEWIEEIIGFRTDLKKDVDRLFYGDVVKKDCDVALIPVGYSDGYPTEFSGCHVLIGGELCPVVSMSMETMAADVRPLIHKLRAEGETLPSALEAIKQMEVVLIGSQGDKAITVYDFLKWQKISPDDFSRKMVETISNFKPRRSQGKVATLVEALNRALPRADEETKHLIRKAIPSVRSLAAEMSQDLRMDTARISAELNSSSPNRNSSPDLADILLEFALNGVRDPEKYIELVDTFIDGTGVFIEPMSERYPVKRLAALKALAGLPDQAPGIQERIELLQWVNKFQDTWWKTSAASRKAAEISVELLRKAAWSEGLSPGEVFEVVSKGLVNPRFGKLRNGWLDAPYPKKLTKCLELAQKYWALERLDPVQANDCRFVLQFVRKYCPNEPKIIKNRVEEACRAIEEKHFRT